MTNELTTDVTQSMQVVITGTDDTVPLEDPVFAVNWFDTKQAWLYFLYNVFAAPSVRAVRAKVVIKGKVTSVLMGEAEDRRGMLLVVRYPSGSNFLQLVQRRSFQAAGLLRKVAVSRFAFGFMQPTVKKAAQPDANKSLAYVICHFRGADIGPDLTDLAARHGAVPVFGGRLVARLATRKVGADQALVSFPMDGAVILQAANADAFTQILSDPDISIIAEKSDGLFIATFDRIM